MSYLTVDELLRRTDDIEELLSVVENGHPSIDKDHFCWKALKQLGRMTDETIYKKYAKVHGTH
jgi:hypothetical protein